MAKKLIFQHQWGEEALREYQDHVISMVEDHPQNMQYSRHISCLAGNCSFTINWQDDASMCDAKSTRSECICRRFSKKLGNDISTDERDLDQ